MKNTTVLGAALALLTACGPLYDNSAAKGFLGVVQQRFGGGEPAQPAAPVLTRAQADANPGAFMLVTAYGGNSVASLVVASTNGNRVTWLSADNVAVTLENGIIAATRGFPRDLIAAEVSGVRAAIAAGGGNAQRIHETITDLDQISQEVLQCSIALTGSETVEILGKSTPTRRFDESCQGENTAFSNTYWVAAGGAIIKSNQAVSPGTGFLVLERP